MPLNGHHLNSRTGQTQFSNLDNKTKLKKYFQLWFSKPSWHVWQFLVAILLMIAAGGTYAFCNNHAISAGLVQKKIIKEQKRNGAYFNPNQAKQQTYNANQAQSSQKIKDKKFAKPQYVSNQELPGRDLIIGHRLVTDPNAVSLTRIMQAKPSQVAALRGWMSYPSKGIAQPIYEGDSSLVLSVGAGTAKPREVMGKRNFAIAAHNFFWWPIYFTNLQRDAATGGKVYVTDGKEVYIYRIQHHYGDVPYTDYPMVENHKKATPDKYVKGITYPNDKKHAIITLQTCYIPLSQAHRLHPFTHIRIMEQGRLIKKEPFKDLSHEELIKLFQPNLNENNKAMEQYLHVIHMLWLISILMFLISLAGMHELEFARYVKWNQPTGWFDQEAIDIFPQYQYLETIKAFFNKIKR